MELSIILVLVITFAEIMYFIQKYELVTFNYDVHDIQRSVYILWINNTAINVLNYLS